MNFLKSNFQDRPVIPYDTNLHPKFKPYSLSAAAYPVDRDVAEKNNLYTQLVSYSVIFNPNQKKAFIAKRISGDKRLLGTYCLGFGGHLNTEDIDLNIDMFSMAAKRELEEEVNLYKNNVEYKKLCYVRDMNSSTNEHLGLVFIIYAGKASINEVKNLEGFWCSYEDLKNVYYEKLESWSKYILDYLYEDPYWSKELLF